MQNNDNNNIYIQCNFISRIRRGENVLRSYIYLCEVDILFSIDLWLRRIENKVGLKRK